MLAGGLLGLLSTIFTFVMCMRSIGCKIIEYNCTPFYHKYLNYRSLLRQRLEFCFVFLMSYYRGTNALTCNSSYNSFSIQDNNLLLQKKKVAIRFYALFS